MTTIKPSYIIITALVLLLAGTIIYFESCHSKPVDAVTAQLDSVRIKDARTADSTQKAITQYYDSLKQISDKKLDSLQNVVNKIEADRDNIKRKLNQQFHDIETETNYDSVKVAYLQYLDSCRIARGK